MNYENIWSNCNHITINSHKTATKAYRNNMGGIFSDWCNPLLYYCIIRNVWIEIGYQQFKLQERIMKLQFICLCFKMKKLTGDYHQFFSKGFSKYFTVNLNLISLHHAGTVRLTSLPHDNLTEIVAFSISWSALTFSAFLAFILTGAAIAKIRRQQFSWIMIIPWWKT